MPFETSLEKFSGPLHLLLQLIEQEKLPITEISLAKVTDDYLKYLNEHDVPTEELADFLVVASRLLLLKSQAILPVPVLDEEEDAGKLADQLRLYQLFVGASKHIESLIGARRAMFGRERTVLPQKQEFTPPQNGTSHALRDAFLSVIKRLEPFFALRQASLERVVTVSERIRQIRDVILERSRLTFADIANGAKNKVEVVVSFLALLELMKQRVVRAVQKESFQDIMITHSD
jgi:segregation and condensation protein A